MACQLAPVRHSYFIGHNSILTLSTHIEFKNSINARECLGIMTKIFSVGKLPNVLVGLIRKAVPGADIRSVSKIRTA